MTSRYGSGWIFALGVALIPASIVGCGDAFNAGPIDYEPSERLSIELKDKPILRKGIADTLAKMFGPAPREIVVPAGSGLPEGGRRLGRFEKIGDDLKPVVGPGSDGKDEELAGGYGLYRKYCLHCHGIQGAGDGPTAEFLYPRPRDYRPGVFKFTSVNPSNPKASRADLRKTLVKGLDGTSMPAFEALMTGSEIEQVIDYVIFLSMRGEVEKLLIDEAKTADGDDIAALSPETVQELAENVFGNWKSAEEQVVSPSARRSPPSPESIARGRDIFLGVNTTGNKAACTDCHGLHAAGDGASFVDKKIFDKVVFRRKPIEEAISERYKEVVDETRAAHHAAGESATAEAAPIEPFESYKERVMTAWKPGSIDDWGNPLRPANLNLGIYKGGQRPIDLYWRLAKGINGAKMPAHASLLPDDQIWDVVNFILALPYDPGLLKDAEALKRRAASPASAAAATP